MFTLNSPNYSQFVWCHRSPRQVHIKILRILLPYRYFQWGNPQQIAISISSCNTSLIETRPAEFLDLSSSLQPSGLQIQLHCLLRLYFVRKLIFSSLGVDWTCLNGSRRNAIVFAEAQGGHYKGGFVNAHFRSTSVLALI